MYMDQYSAQAFEKNAKNLSKALGKVGVSATDASKALVELTKKLEPYWVEVRVANLITYLYYKFHPEWREYARGRFIRHRDYDKLFRRG